MRYFIVSSLICALAAPVLADTGRGLRKDSLAKRLATRLAPVRVYQTPKGLVTLKFGLNNGRQTVNYKTQQLSDGTQIRTKYGTIRYRTRDEGRAVFVTKEEETIRPNDPQYSPMTRGKELAKAVIQSPVSFGLGTAGLISLIPAGGPIAVKALVSGIWGLTWGKLLSYYQMKPNLDLHPEGPFVYDFPAAKDRVTFVPHAKSPSHVRTVRESY